MRWEKNKEKYHIAGLDGLRGIGALGVLLFHMFPGAWKGGYAGVLLFFVLSGYLLALSSRRSWDRGHFWIGDYYKKRILRIYPALIAVVFITLGFLTLLAPKVLIGIRSEVGSILLGYNNLWQIAQNASYFTRISKASPFTHLWFLAIEMQFYLVWPLFFWIYCRMKEGRFGKLAEYFMLVPAGLSILSLILNYVPGEDVTRVYYGTDTRVFSMFLGAFLGLRKADRSHRLVADYGEQRRAVWIRKWGGILFSAAMVVLLAVYLLMDGEAEFTYRVGLIAFTVFSCWLIWLCANENAAVGETLDATPLSWIGKRSYEIYLWQYPVIFLFQYHRKDKTLLSVLLMLFFIVALSLWLETVIRWMRHKISFGGKRMKYVKKTVISLMTVVMMCAFVLGGCSFFTAAKDDGGEQEKLESELKKNSEELEEQKKKDQKEEQDQTKETTSQETQEAQESENAFITAIGDSVMLGAAPALQETIPGCVVDAAESRQVVKAKATVESLKSQGKLGDTVVLGLGTNGPFKTSVGQDLLNAIGAEKTVYWVNVYGAHLNWQDESNQTIAELARQNENVHIIDWAGPAAEHPEWFYNDGIHLKPAGQKAYAQLVFQSIAED